MIVRFTSYVWNAGVASVALLALAGVASAEPPDRGWSSRPARTTWAETATTVPFDWDTGRPVILARVNGVDWFTFAVETADVGAALDDDVVRELQLKPTEVAQPAGTEAAKERPSKFVLIERLEFAGNVFSDVPVAVRDFDLTARRQRECDGSLGLSVFADGLLTIDYLQQRAVVRPGELPAPDGREVLAAHEVRGLLAIPLAWGDVAVEGVIDTSSLRAFVLPESSQDRVPVLSEPAPDAGGENPAPRKPTEVRLKDAVRLGGHELVEPPVLFHGTGGRIGQRVLRYFSLTLDQRNGRVRLARPKLEPIQIPAPSRFGFGLGNSAKGAVIVELEPGSPAAKRGLRMGDVVMTIDGMRAMAFTQEAIRSHFDQARNLLMEVDRGGVPLLVVVAPD